MELRDYIEQGATKAGNLTQLGKLLGQDQRNMTSAKSHRRPLPLDAAVRLADSLETDLRAVIAANELVTEKKEEKRAFWTPFVQHAKAASIALTFSLVTNFVTPSPAEAAPVLKTTRDAICIMLSRRFKRHLKQSQLARPMLRFFKRLEESLIANFAPRIAQI